MKHRAGFGGLTLFRVVAEPSHSRTGYSCKPRLYSNKDSKDRKINARAFSPNLMGLSRMQDNSNPLFGGKKEITEQTE
jgi:hypothetical protein